jgi:hypothetical protein
MSGKCCLGTLFKLENYKQLNKDLKMNQKTSHNFRTLQGMTFGRLTVLQRHPLKTKAGKVRWVCACTCGNEKIVEGSALVSKRANCTRSCGCLRIEANKARATHGHSPRGKVSTEYQIWGGMVKRCTNRNFWAYNRYGGRGITVCEAWLKFEGFFADMGKRPAGLSLERIDNNKGYSPENCKWATKSEQMRNRNFGKKKCKN